MAGPLILPGDPLFDLTLATAIPPGWRQTADQCGQQVAFVAAPGDGGLLRPATPAELEDYLEGGEYDDRQAELEDQDDGQLVLYGSDIP
jgi:hypothetical protein